MIKESGIVERLEPCPFCGATDLTLTVDRHGWKVVECNDCGMKGPCIDLEGSEYLTRWNTRPAATLIAELQAERDRIKAFLSEGSWATIESEQAWKRRALAAESSLHRVRGETIEECARLAGQDARRWEVAHGIIESVRELVRLHISPEHRPPALFKMVQDVVYAFRGRTDIASALRSLASQEAVPNADAPGNVGLVRGISSDQTPLNKTGLDSGAVKTAESEHSPSTREE